jgi:hypothetical protein
VAMRNRGANWRKMVEDARAMADRTYDPAAKQAMQEIAAWNSQNYRRHRCSCSAPSYAKAWQLIQSRVRLRNPTNPFALVRCYRRHVQGSLK